MESTLNEPKLTRKQQAFVKELTDNPTQSATKAAIKAGYAPKNARVTASQNLSKPIIKSKLDKHNSLFESTIVKTVRTYKDSDRLGERTLAVKTAQWAHDKINGTAVQRVQTENLHLTMAIESPDLSYYKDRHKQDV